MTGGTDGIGKEIARGLAIEGVQVIIVGRDATKGCAARDEINQDALEARVHFLRADLSLMHEVQGLADTVSNDFPHLDFLVHCAGAVIGRRILTAEGVETNFAVNYLSRFLLTRLLLSRLDHSRRPASSGRVLILSGAAHGKVHFSDVNLSSRFTTLGAVSQVCRANDLLTIELTRRLAEDHPQISVTCLKIGVVRTRIRGTFPVWMKLLVPLLIDPFLAQPASEVAKAALELLLKPVCDVAGAVFIKVRKLKRVKIDASSQTLEEAQRLWELSEDLIRGVPGVSLTHRAWRAT